MISNPRRGASLVASAIVTLSAGVSSAQTSPAAELDAAYARKATHDYAGARLAFERARAAGASEQRIALELGYLSAAEDDVEGARRRYEDAARGGDPALARRARLELEALGPAPSRAAPAAPAAPALDEAYRAKASGDLRGAAIALRRARESGADPQLVAMELGYVAAASARFVEAEHGPNADLGARARREVRVLPAHLHADAYADAFAWNRISGAANGDSVVPTLRVRGFYRPVIDVPFELYGSGQATRDTASHGFVGPALPQVYADDYAVFGAGARLRLWKDRIDLFGQVGPAFDLLDDGRDRVAVDARAGVVAYVETRGCAPSPEATARAGFWPCLEGYGEAVYASRFHHDVIAFVRPRAAAGYLVTGPVLWQAVVEGRAAKDKNDDYWNDFADAGAGHRWRLLAPLRVDLLLTANAGSYYGSSGRDPAPARLGYVEARGLVTTYVEVAP